MANGILGQIANPPGTNMPERLSDLATARQQRQQSQAATEAQNLQNARTRLQEVGRSAKALMDTYYPEGQEQPTNPAQAAKDYFKVRDRLVNQMGVPEESVPNRIPRRSELQQAFEQAQTMEQQMAQEESQRQAQIERQKAQRLSKSDMVKANIDGQDVWVPAQAAAGLPTERGDQDVLEPVNAYSPQLADRFPEGFTAYKTPQGLMRPTRDEEGNITLIPAPPDVTERTIEGSAEDVGLGTTEQRNLRNQEVNTKNFISTTKDALDLLEDNRNINTWTGKASAVINDLQQEANALASNFGDDIQILNSGRYEGTFDEMGIQNRRMKSLITSLGYQLARSREGGRLSDTDVRMAIQSLGGSASDPRALSQTLVDVARRSADRFKTSYETRIGSPYEDDLGTENLSPIGSQEEQQEEAGGMRPDLRYNPDTGELEEVQ